jgi:outer membrane receptor protein involved in Fe transport
MCHFFHFLFLPDVAVFASATPNDAWAHKRSREKGETMDSSRILLVSASAVALAAALSTTAAQAQTTPSRSSSGGKSISAGIASQEATTMSEITVTAAKRQELLINVPVAASALGYTQLQQYAANDLGSIAAQLPGVELQETGGGSSGASFSIRGVGNLAVDYGNEQPVALVIDGMQLTRGHAIDIGAFDVAQVEVLEGPQALFFGKNSPAGVVSLNTVSPGRTFEGYVRGGYEVATRTPFGEFAVSLPVTDTLSVRFALRYSDMQGGTVTNLARPIADPFPGETGFMLPGASGSQRPETRFVIGRFTAVWRPNDAFDATLKFSGSDYHDDGESLEEGVAACAPGNSHPTTTDLLDPALSFQDPFGSCTVAGGTISNGNAPPQITSHFVGGPANGQPFGEDLAYLTTLTMNYRLGKVTFTSVTGFYDAVEAGYDNYDLTVFAQALDAQRDDNKTVTQEFRATSAFDGPLNFAAGGFYEHDDRTLTNTDKIFPLGPYPGPGPYSGAYNTLALVDDNLGDSYSLFGQLKWKILPTLEIAGGARWSHDAKSTDAVNIFNFLDLILPTAYDPFAPGGEHFHPRISEDDTSPEVTLTWRPRSGLTFYGAYKEGYLAGGSSNPGNLSNYDVLCATANSVKAGSCASPDSLLEYKPEKAKGGEIGAKASLLDGAFYADLTFYRYQFTNLQVTSFDAATTSFFTTNAASALNQGFEAKVRYNVDHDLQLHGFVAYTDLYFQSYPGAECYSGQAATTGCVGGVQDLSGTAYGGAPWEINVGANYRRELSGDWDLGLAGDLYCRTRTPRPNNDPSAPGGEAYCQENASLRVYQAHGPWELAVIGVNLGDVRYVLPAGTGKPLGAPGDLDSIVGPPREVTLQATYRF